MLFMALPYSMYHAIYLGLAAEAASPGSAGSAGGTAGRDPARGAHQSDHYRPNWHSTTTLPVQYRCAVQVLFFGNPSGDRNLRQASDGDGGCRRVSRSTAQSMWRSCVGPA